MKKWTMIIAWILVFCLAGCQEAGINNTQPPTQAQPTQQPTQMPTQQPTQMPTQQPTEETLSEDERITALMYDYNEIVGSLEQYTYGGVISISTGDRTRDFSGNEAMAYAYQKLQALAEIDPWLNEAAWAERVYPGYYPNFDRQSYLDQFTVLEDVLIRVDYDSYHENGDHITHEEGRVAYSYNPDGTLCYIHNGVRYLEEFQTYNHVTAADLFYCYGEDGQVVKMYFGDPGDYRITLTQTFDDQGHLIEEKFAKDAVINRITYDYNDAGQLVEKVLYENVDWDETLSLRYVTQYTYNAEGLLIREEEKYMNFDSNGDPAYVNYSITVEYTYDAEGRRQSAVQTGCIYTLVDSERNETKLFTTTVSEFAYEYDEQGRLLTRRSVYHPAQYADGTDPMIDDEITVEAYVYGDCYVYGSFVVEP